MDIPLTSNEHGGRSEGSLCLLRSGPLPPDPGELVASDHAERLIQSLRDKADVVYVDCPPMLVAGDALAIVVTAMPSSSSHGCHGPDGHR